MAKVRLRSICSSVTWEFVPMIWRDQIAVYVEVEGWGGALSRDRLWGIGSHGTTRDTMHKYTHPYIFLVYWCGIHEQIFSWTLDWGVIKPVHIHFWEMRIIDESRIRLRLTLKCNSNRRFILILSVNDDLIHRNGYYQVKAVLQPTLPGPSI